jgi:hypothetical protein
MDEINIQEQQEQQRDFINDLYKSLQKDLTKDKGDFITNFAQKRDFPSAFSKISSDNQVLIKDFYQKSYEFSLQAYLDSRGSAYGFNVMNVINTYNSIVEFIFGNDKHYGAYSAVLDMYKKKKQPYTDAVEVITSCESLYNLNYKVKSTEDGFYLFDPSLNPINKISEPAEQKTESYNYLDSLQKLLKTAIQNKTAVTSFEVPADSEKANFPVPDNHKSLLVTLPDILKEDSYSFERAKANDLHVASQFNGNTFSFSNVSFIGSMQRNYHYMGWSYANHRIIKDLSDKYGFVFITTPPTKFLVDSDGYLVSKVSYINNEIAQTTFACTPENMSNIMMWRNQLSIQGQITLTKELSTYLLVQLGFGYNSIDTNFFFLDEDTREIVHFVENEPDFVKRQAYPSAPNNLINIQVNDAAQFVMDARTIKLIAENIVKTNNFSDTAKYSLFGFDEFHLVQDSMIQNLDKISMAFLPKQLFMYEHGVFTSAGKDILNGKNIMYNDWFSEHIKKSGMSVNSSLTIQILNRLSLFSAIAYLISL